MMAQKMIPKAMEITRKRQNGNVIAYTSSGAKREFIHNGKRYLQIITPNFYRDILIPEHKVYENEIVYCLDEYETVKGKTEDLSKKKIEAENYEKLEKIRLAEESKERKRLMCKDEPTEEVEPDEIELEIAENEERLQNRSAEFRLEEEEEVKKCNALVLQSQCQAVRDVQVAEKRLIKAAIMEDRKKEQEMWRENQFLEMKRNEETKAIENQKKRRFLHSLKSQVKEKELEEKIRVLGIREEARLFKEAICHGQLKEMKVIQKKREAQAKMRQQIQSINSRLNYFNRLENEENRRQDQQRNEFLKHKLNMENEIKAERLEKQRKKDAILQMQINEQLKAKEVKDLKEAIALTKREDEIAREWRIKEKEAILRKIHIKECMKKEREDQLYNTGICQAVEMENQRREQERIAKVNRKAILEDQKRIRHKRQVADQGRMTLLQQINDKEKQVIRDRQEKFQEGKMIRLIEKQRVEKVENHLENKLQRARAFNLPERYIMDIRRQLKLK